MKTKASGITRSIIFVIIVILVGFSFVRAGEDEWMALTDKGYGYYKSGKYKEAIEAARQALKMGEEIFGPDDLKVVGSIDDLASYLSASGNNTEAEELYMRALAILEKRLPPDDSYLAIFLDYIGVFYDKIGRADEAAKYKARAKKIRFEKNKAAKKKQ